MKIFLQILSIAVISYFSEQLFPWWSIAVVSFAVLIISPAGSPGTAFITGFTGIAFLWLILAWTIDLETGGLLSGKVADLFHIGSRTGLILVTAFTGGIIGGLAGWSAYALRNSFSGATP